MSQIEKKLLQLGYKLPAPVTPLANYIPAYRAGNLVFLSGTGPIQTDGTILTGKLGDDLTVDQGYEAARLCALNLLANLQETIRDFNKLKQIVKLLGMVNATPKFTQHPDVINGCSDLLVEVLGDKGRHARSAVGMVSLPHNYAVEIEMIVEVEE